MAIAPTLATLVITISTQSAVPSTLVDRVIAEADSIWRSAALTLIWNRQADAGSSLTVVIGPARGTVDPRGSDQPLGWTLFERETPRPYLYVSYANALDLFENARGVVGPVGSMPILERETYLGRAMGRALAHELGHYLLASKEHTKTGLMKANRTAYEFFSSERGRFDVTPVQRAIVDSHLNAERVAAATPASAPASSSRRASPHS
jgi:hypothetical protein